MAIVIFRYSLSFPRNSAYIDITTNIYLKEHAAAIDEFCNHCAYTGDVFTVFAKARELRATMLERLSEDLRADVAPVGFCLFVCLFKYY